MECDENTSWYRRVKARRESLRMTPPPPGAPFSACGVPMEEPEASCSSSRGGGGGGGGRGGGCGGGGGKSGKVRPPRPPPRCKKVYHAYCMGFNVADDELSSCPRHACVDCADAADYFCRCVAGAAVGGGGQARQIDVVPPWRQQFSSRVVQRCVEPKRVGRASSLRSLMLPAPRKKFRCRPLLCPRRKVLPRLPLRRPLSCRPLRHRGRDVRLPGAPRAPAVPPNEGRRLPQARPPAAAVPAQAQQHERQGRRRRRRRRRQVRRGEEAPRRRRRRRRGEGGERFRVPQERVRLHGVQDGGQEGGAAVRADGGAGDGRSGSAVRRERGEPAVCLPEGGSGGAGGAGAAKVLTLFGDPPGLGRLDSAARPPPAGSCILLVVGGARPFSCLEVYLSLFFFPHALESGVGYDMRHFLPEAAPSRVFFVFHAPRFLAPPRRRHRRTPSWR